ncbi:MAG: phosphatidate cytidylyltransferase, partial [Oscillospiraceae bacterium]|nr:phosphatidate cytidylyltransferase [Oscillospiraceae bacterium]
PITLLMLTAEALQITAFILPTAFITLLYFTMLMIKKLQEIDFVKLCGTFGLSAVVISGFYALVHFKTLLPTEIYGFDGVLMILLCLAFAWGSDAFAYFCGRAWGKHKLAPVVSPNKTVEGFIGGFFGSVFFGLAICVAYSYLAPLITGQPFVALRGQSYFILVIMALISCPLGVAGDLFASAIKRQCKIKDYGTIFSGHGGILDRFDSVLFITPFVAMLTSFCVNSLGTVFF